MTKIRELDDQGVEIPVEDDSDDWVDEEEEDNEDDWEDDDSDEEEEDGEDDDDELGADITELFCFSESFNPNEYIERIKSRGGLVVEHPEDFLRVCLFDNESDLTNEDEKKAFAMLTKRKTREDCFQLLSEEEKKYISHISDDYTVVIITSKEDYQKKTPTCQLASFLIDYTQIMVGSIVNSNFLDIYLENPSKNVDDIIYSESNDCSIGIPFQTNHPVFLLSTSEEKMQEMRQYFSEKDVPIMSREVYDFQPITLSDCTIVMNEEFFSRDPKSLTLEEIDILQFYVHTNGITFERAKELFEECKDISSADYDYCEEMLKKMNIFQQVYNFSTINKRRFRRRILDEAKSKEFTEHLKELPIYFNDLIENIPNEIIYHILPYLPVHELLQFRLLSHVANLICLQDFLWKDVCSSTCKNHHFLKPLLSNEKIFNLPYMLIYRNHIQPLIIDYKQIKKEMFLENLAEEKVFKQFITPALFIDTCVSEDSSVPIGTTKMSGEPDLPKGFDSQRIVNLTLLLQLNIEENKDSDLFGLAYQVFKQKSSMFPTTGILFIFCNSDDELSPSKVFHYVGSTDNLERLKRSANDSRFCFTVKFYEALSLCNDSQNLFAKDIDEYEKQLNKGDDDKSEKLSQSLHAPFLTSEPHKLFGALPVLYDDEWYDENDDASSSGSESEDDYEEDPYFYIDLNQFATPLIQLSEDSKTQENNILESSVDVESAFLLAGSGEGVAVDKDCTWKEIMSLEDGSKLFELQNHFTSCFSYQPGTKMYKKYNHLVKQMKKQAKKSRHEH
ncbi:hypothetical protein NAEGRDRAFT_82213 [Naegleria gruberi]|uniref:F-box domain-containing protein n=1 Tax=Naegleria gruberi TaxID=5762 RepID=D2W376_NAEGR|nr:uncharacterized protein NAEGRDRAFT_82213 [Naegleria gruberi]EFC36440.1 hypothetical protein NAEGRDRAFT_82213 [Naegleria gruberi]|eukprot:XP_002669184.1 hypothetical protein NAEGRDRAFT_82213 [Naegleria gruberi strain NEG-M]